jgi:hypothetical protein
MVVTEVEYSQYLVSFVVDYMDIGEETRELGVLGVLAAAAVNVLARRFNTVDAVVVNKYRGFVRELKMYAGNRDIEVKVGSETSRYWIHVSVKDGSDDPKTIAKEILDEFKAKTSNKEQKEEPKEEHEG